MKGFPNEIASPIRPMKPRYICPTFPRNCSAEIFASLRVRISSRDQEQCAKMRSISNQSNIIFIYVQSQKGLTTVLF